MNSKNVNKINVGKKIKQIRLSRGWTLKQFSDELSNIIGDNKTIAEGVISRWESGISLPNPKRLKAIAKIADISVEELLYGTFDERLATILIKTMKENDKYKTLDYGEVYNHIKKKVFSTDLSDKEIETLVNYHLKIWVGKEQVENVSLTEDESKYVLEYVGEYIDLLNLCLELKQRDGSNEPHILPFSNEEIIERIKILKDKFKDVPLPFGFENIQKYF